MLLRLRCVKGNKGLANDHNEIRLEEVRRELAETDRSILEIAVSCGFSEASFFNRLSRRTLRCSPSEYRAQERRCERTPA